MKFANSKQIIGMMLFWALALIAYDRFFSKHLFAPEPEAIVKFTTPQVRMWIDHVGCSGGLEDVLRAIKTLPWLGQPEVVGEAGTTQVPGSCGKAVIVDVRDVEKADFMELSNTLRKLGIVPAAMEFGGIPHFALKAEVSRHIHCPECVHAAKQAMTPKKDPKVGRTLKWLDSARVHPEEQTISAYVRFGYAAHVEEMMQALDQAGFPPGSIRIVVGTNA